MIHFNFLFPLGWQLHPGPVGGDPVLRGRRHLQRGGGGGHHADGRRRRPGSGVRPPGLEPAGRLRHPGGLPPGRVRAGGHGQDGPDLVRLRRLPLLPHVLPAVDDGGLLRDCKEDREGRVRPRLRH